MATSKVFRTDENNNPAAFTTAVAEMGLVENTDYVQGTPFTSNGSTYWTAKLLGDPIAITIKLIDKIGFYTLLGGYTRWTYISIPSFVWKSLTLDMKRDVIGFMYRHEGGETMKSLFPNYNAT